MWPLLLSAMAGDPAAVCAAVAEADVVVELSFRSTGEYPAAWKRKRFEPPEEAILPTVRTAQVARVWKGSVEGWTPEVDDLDLSNQPAAWWDRFFGEGEFRALLLLRGQGAALESTGWIADQGACHMSWCWEPLRSEVLACLGAPTAAPTAAPTSPSPTPPSSPVDPAPATPSPARPGGWLKGCAGG